MIRLIVNADDFGLTPGVNAAIAELHDRGVVSSTTLMAGGACFREAVPLALGRSNLGVGCHVVLVDGVPVLPPEKISSLLDPKADTTGAGGPRFRPTLRAFVTDLARGCIRKAELEAEVAAQIERIQSGGIQVTHLDSHKHTHILPMVAGCLARAALARGIHALRNPFEPAWSVRATSRAGRLRRWGVRALGVRRAAFTRLLRNYGLETTDGLIGIAATGFLNGAALESLLAAVPDGTWELMCHPGYQDAALARTRTRLRREREIERDALLKAIPPAIGRGLSLIHYGEIEHSA